MSFRASRGVSCRESRQTTASLGGDCRRWCRHKRHQPARTVGPNGRCSFTLVALDSVANSKRCQGVEHRPFFLTVRVGGTPQQEAGGGVLGPRGAGAHQLLLHRNVQRFQGRLVFKAHRLLHHSTLGLRVMKKKEHGVGRQAEAGTALTRLAPRCACGARQTERDT